jgi:hypothetical protein
MARPASGLELIQRVVKGVAIAVGGACTFVSFASLVGVVTGNAWARAIAALVLLVALPAVAVDRSLPRGEGERARSGLVGDVVALVLVGIALLYIGIGQPVTRPLLVHEGDRLAEDGRDVPAHVVYFLAGVRPVDAPAIAAPNPSSHGGP